MSLKSLSELVDQAKTKGPKRLVACAAEDDAVIKAVSLAVNEKIIEPIFVGNGDKIKEIAKQINCDISSIEIIEESNPAQAAKIAVKLINDGKADILMKGLIGTADFLRAVLDKENGLRKGKLLSHIGLFECPSYHKLLGITDAAQNVCPSLEDKVTILKNSIEVYHKLGIENPKIAAVCAIEGVNPKMPATTDAAALAMMNQRKQIKGCTLDGPLALDNAISAEAAKHKGIESEVAGDVDLLLTHDIEMGNVLYKAMSYLAGGSCASVLLGARVPVVLTSRADSDKSKLQSIALATNLA
ncbi:MAG: bifunctional enoyl-CoA hydratase/phosphate acetyltransferase [Bacteriovoracia bacterium]